MLGRWLRVETISERDVVVGAAAEVRAGVLFGRHGRPRLLGRTIAAAAQHLDVLRDDLGREALLPGLVLPLPGANPAFDEDLPALREVLADDLGLLPPHHDPVPLRGFLLLPALVGPALRGRDAQVRHGLPALGEAHLGVRAQIADQDHLVDAAHARLPIGSPLRGPDRSSIGSRARRPQARWPRDGPLTPDRAPGPRAGGPGRPAGARAGFRPPLSGPPRLTESAAASILRPSMD